MHKNYQDGSALHADGHAAASSSTTPPSMAFSRGFAWCQMLFLTGAVLILALTLAMMSRMYPTLSTPTKTMVCMMAASFVGAVVSLTQAWHQLGHLLGGHFLAPDDGVCRYSHPLFEAMQTVTWWGHLLLAWVTWKTIDGRKTSPLMLNVLLYGVSVLIGVLVTVGLVLQAPGKVMWGLFCVTPFLVDSNHLDIRWFRGLLCQVTLGLSILLYASGYWKLWRKGKAHTTTTTTTTTGAGAAAAPPITRQTLRLRRASKALLQRAVLILVAYYLPYVIIHCVLSLIQEKDVAPSPTYLALFFLAFVFGQSVLQALILIQAAVTVGHNLLRSSGGEEGAYDTAGTDSQQQQQQQKKTKQRSASEKGQINSEEEEEEEVAGEEVIGSGNPSHPNNHTPTLPPDAATTSPITTATKKIKKRAMYDPRQRSHLRTRSRDSVQVMATIYEVTFKKGRGRRFFASPPLAVNHYGREGGGLPPLSSSAPGAAAAARAAATATAARRVGDGDSKSLIQEYLGPGDVEDYDAMQHLTPPYSPEETMDGSADEELGYEDEHDEHSLNSPFDDGGRSVVLSDDGDMVQDGRL